MKGRTVKIRLSMRVIDKYSADGEVARLRDDKQPKLIFQYSSADRSFGSWYIVYYNKATKSRSWVVFGKYPEMTVKQARESVSKALVTISTSESTDVVKGVAVAGELGTVSDLLANYYQAMDGVHQISTSRKRAISSAVYNHLIPLLGDRPVDKLTALNVESAFVPLRNKGLNTSTLRMIFGVLQSAYKRANTLKLINYHPVKGIAAHEFIAGTVVERQCRLTSSQLEPMFRRLHAGKFETWALISLTFSTLCRIGEVATARWRHVDFESMVWTLPATKNGTTHKVYMSWVTAQVLRTLKSHQKEKGIRTDYLFPSRRNRSRPLTEDAAAKRVSRFARDKWSSHDLRKFARSWVSNQGISGEISEYLLNHLLVKTQRPYVQRETQEAAAKAWDMWGEYLHLKGIISKDKTRRYSGE